MWTRKSVQTVLETHQNYASLFEEFEGKFACEYIVSGVRVLVFNCVGGVPEIWFGYSIAENANLGDAQEFVRIAYAILRERANQQGH